ncbi:MAG TPA: bifunctional diguanylate cyclase/phosphodiesterase [Steroidobacteraceae bacterium]|nr:bifunctional diguanylate cyclase/phosphodiesterase [Steroidobacteraceae bacterium]
MSSALFESYVQLTEGLLPNVTGICLLDGQLRPQGEHGDLAAAELMPALRARSGASRPQEPESVELRAGCQTCLIPLAQTDGVLLGYFCVQHGRDSNPAIGTEATARKLKPVLDCLHRELAAAQPLHSKMRVLTERTAELEWLFGVTGRLNLGRDEHGVIGELLRAACERLGSSLAVLQVPEKQLCMKFSPPGVDAAALSETWQQTGKHLLTWVERQNRPLVINGGGVHAPAGRRSKILSVPLLRDSGRTIGILAFFRAEEATDFESHQVFMARHLGREAAALVEAQFDLMTGLYTRDGLEQVYRKLVEDRDSPDGSVLYLDIDSMDLVNELHGFELGNEVIVRVAELLAPPLLPQTALASRLSGDRFAVVLPETEPVRAGLHAARIQAAAVRLSIGPAASPVEVSISCGVAALVNMPQGLARAIAAAEIACKRAKTHGRNRMELYSCDDTSIMRRNDDIAAVAQLRAAFKADQLLLYAQRIVPLQNSESPGSYEILMRVRDPDGDLVAPGPLIVAAQRYQLLPSIDRRILEGAVQALAPYRSMLQQTKIAFSINVTGQSICDEDFVNRFAERLGQAHLPRGSVTIEITEQAAVTNLARASEMIRRLGSIGCQLALDDFGTGANSLSNLKTLQVARVKIDGSFVRDVLTDRRSQTTVRAIVELAKGYGIDTVAEYVETLAIAEMLRKIGVDYAQGYAFSKPEPLADVLRALSKGEAERLQELFLEN